ncbi:recombinase family protein [Paracoccus aminophilus]|uniref:Resolvase domain-containing protein n=1 Tax=Paracoccus aminophilus JCM 7686 TaxID=1367847 RepID=S5XQC3_PARAH|nr:recombinase family protein [Paracoccus aminophilus]AGT07252.1 resolvase domain-containing protein [Paracoccus aminophilus JCM 7686]
MARFVIYTRSGPEDLGRADVSLAAQNRDIELYLADYVSAPDILGHYCDRLTSIEERARNLDTALSLCQETGATLLVARTDRLPFDDMGFAPFFANAGLALRVASLPDAPKSELLVFARLQAQERRFDHRQARQALPDEITTRQTYQRPRGHDQIEQIARIALPLRHRGATMGDIASELNRAGITTARGAAWRATNVSRILSYLETNPAT